MYKDKTNYEQCHLIVSGSLIRVSVVNDTLPPDLSVKFLWLG